MKRILKLSVIFVFLLAFFKISNCEEKKVVLGIGRVDGKKYNVEFRKYHRIVPFYRKNGIEPVLFNYEFLPRYGRNAEQIYNQLSKFNVVHIDTTSEGVGPVFDEKAKRSAKEISNGLKKYVEEGGGLLIAVQSVRYPNDKDEQYWNEVLKVFGIEILHEGVFDKTREYEAKLLNKEKFFFTQNISSHPVTEGVKCLYLPLHNYYPGPGVVAIKYSKDWKIIVRGEKEAKSYKSGTTTNPNIINLNTPGTYKSRPPIVAVREFGKGRIVSYPLPKLFTGLNYLNPLWEGTVEDRGDPSSGRKSYSMKLQINAYRWLAEPSMKMGKFGTYKFKPYKRVKFPESVNWDKYKFSQAYKREGDEWLVEPAKLGKSMVKGIVGAHTSYTDGKGTVFDYVKEARKQGLSFIVFTDPLELLKTQENLKRLIEDCKKANEKYKDFYACPGIEFTDGDGIRWIMIGERLKFPPSQYKQRQYTYTQWDGKRVNLYGHFAMLNAFPPTAIIDYKQLRKAGGYPENLWWFFNYIPVAYEKNKIIADNYHEFLYGLRDLRWASLLSFTRIKKPEEIGIARSTSTTIFKNLESAKEALNARCSSYWKAYSGVQQVSGGPVVLQWQAINPQMENNFLYTKGAQRVRMKFEVYSENGIKEVKVHDADYGIIRRFSGKGQKFLSKEFEMVHNKQHYLTLEVIDNKNKRAFSHYILIYCYKQGLFRCGDNLNILGPLGFVWHPDRNQMLPLGKSFRNGYKYAFVGWDTSSPALGVPQPSDRPVDFIRIERIGEYPHRYTMNVFPANIMDVKLASYNIQVVSMNMDHLVPRFDTEEIPTPAMASLPLSKGPLEYFERNYTMVAPMDRADHFIIWNYRRTSEGLEKYEGSFIWHEGYIKIKKDIKLSSMPLIFLQTPVNLENGTGDMLIVKQPEKTKIVRLTKTNPKEYVRGKIKEGGYISWQPTILGYTAVFVPKVKEQSPWAYRGVMPGRIEVGIKPDKKEVKAGQIFKYNFLYGVFADKKPGNEVLENTVKLFNLDGRGNGYPVKIEKGKIIDTVFFFTAEAENNEAVFTLGPTKSSTIIDLPIRVKGIEDNGTAAIFTSKRPWFRFVSVSNNTAYFQEPIERGNKIWAGNIFVARNKNIKMTVVVDGQGKGKKPFIEIHNPTYKDIKTTIWSPEKTPLFGGLKYEVKVPAGSSIKIEIKK